ncbi:MAG: pyruvate kinase [Rhodopirellula sp.]|nr:pyruvate kinase [Rhodopirellula sp.]
MPDSQPPQPSRPSRTKIVATVGPASESRQRLAELIQAGVDVFRINTAHGNLDEHQQRLEAIRGVSSELGQPVAVLADLAGPKMRLGELAQGQLECVLDAELTFIRGREPTRPTELTTTYDPLVDELCAGDRVMLADGLVSLVVEQTGPDYARCRVVQPGLIRSRQGVNLPGVHLKTAALQEADRRNALWAAQNGVDFVGLSFVRKPDEVFELKSLLQSHGSGAQVVAKIEKPEALQRLEEIVEAADAVMVARGDLGVETDIASLAMAQKRIIDLCSRRHKPVIIATQMLDSMQHSRLPTRAEVTDVANAILDGADACMLSGETAIGQYPVDSVKMMHRIALATEPSYRQRPPLPAPDRQAEGINPITEATSYYAGRLAERLDAKMVVVASASGATALSLSKYRNFVPTVGISESEATLRRMCLYWGVFPLAGAPTGSPEEILRHVAERGRAAGSVDSGDRIVLIAGTGLSVSRHNMIVVHQVF